MNSSGKARVAGFPMLPLALMSLVVGLSFSVAMPFLSLFLTTEVHAGPGRVTVVLIAVPLAGVLVSTWIGRVSDRGVSRRATIIATAVAGLSGTLVTAFVREYWMLLAVMVTVNAVAGSLFPQIFAYARQVAEVDDPRRAAMRVSAVRTLFSLAWVIGPPLAALALRHGGFKMVYLMAAGAHAIGALVAWFWLADVDPRGGSAESGETQGAPPSMFAGALPLTVAGFTLLQIPINFGVQALPLFIGHELHRDATDAGFVFGLCAALEIPLMLGLGALTMRYRLRPLILAGAGCGVAYCATVVVASTIWTLGASQVANAIFISAVSALGISYMQERLPGHPGYATTLFANTFPVGAAIAGPLTGLSATIGYRPGYAVAAGLCAIGFLLLLAARPKARAPRPPLTAEAAGWAGRNAA
jgi:SET family sugar efflux transporter-like MFS transporter